MPFCKKLDCHAKSEPPCLATTHLLQDLTHLGQEFNYYNSSQKFNVIKKKHVGPKKFFSMMECW
jgi:hypothetical protein